MLPPEKFILCLMSAATSGVTHSVAQLSPTPSGSARAVLSCPVVSTQLDGFLDLYGHCLADRKGSLTYWSDERANPPTPSFSTQ